MNKTSKTNGTENKQVAVKLAKINEQIATLQQQRGGPLRAVETTLRRIAEAVGRYRNSNRDLDPAWKPAPLKPRAVDKIREIIVANGAPMGEAEILKAVGKMFTPWKTRNTLKKKSQGAKAVFAVNSGKYAVKAAA